MSIYDLAKQYKEDQREVKVFLVNGIKLSGVITEHLFDGLVLTLGDKSQLVFKHAIATIMPV